jgi:PPM family protein phosphatase
MEPIRDLESVSQGDVLHHPALGFAIVEAIDGASVELRWEKPGENHPDRATAGALKKGYRLCPPGGFLARSVLDPDELRRLTMSEPVRALQLLLGDLNEPQRRRDVREWLTNRGLISDTAFDRWWDNVRSLIRHDPAFRWEQQAVFLGEVPTEPPTEDTTDESAPTVDRLVDSFARVGAQEQEELLERLPAQSAERLLGGALDRGDIDLAARILAHPIEIPPDRVEQIRTLGLAGQPVLLGRLTALGDEETLSALAGAAKEADGRPLVAEVLSGLTRRDRVRAVLDLLESLLDRGPDPTAAQFLRDQLPEGAVQDLEREVPPPPTDASFEVVNHLLHHWPRAISWLREHSLDRTIDAAFDDSGLLLRAQPPLAKGRVLQVHTAIARALAERHAAGAHGGLLGARLEPGGRISLGPPEQSDPLRDVRDSFATMLELVVGVLPRSETISPNDVLAHLALLADDLPVDWLALALRGLADGEHQHPRSAVGLWHALEQAQATARVRESSPMRPRVHWEIGHDTHIGSLKSRLGQVNQDALFWTIEGNLALDGEPTREAPVTAGLLIVADGISVSTAGTGDLASAILVQVIGSLWEQQKDTIAAAGPETIRGFLEGALAAANHAICEGSVRLARGDLARHIPMGTTAVVAVLLGNTCHLASLGDSRAYLVTSAGAALITGDQNVRAEWLEAWQRGSPEDRIGEGHALVRYAGHFSETGESLPCEPGYRTFKVLPGEALVLCTDGFTDYASDDPAETARFLEEASREPEMGRAVRDLVDRANARGGGDNVTIVMARLLDT